ncbi:MAG: carboxyltransferase domain-containing protein, partial [Firmicutes bacterium]|nr:carboxyltransferase domain-containing protein [Bacillota bacterium]
PIDSPGGWRLIGKTPLQLFSPRADTPFLLSAGDFLRFVAIDEEEFSSIKDVCQQGKYVPVKEVLSDGGN